MFAVPSGARAFGTLKRGSLALSRRLGLGGLVGRSGWRARRLAILCYHSVALDDEHVWDPALSMSPATLRRRLALLRRCECAVLPLGEALERLANDTLPRRAVALTFDDGYYDFLARAHPLLEEYGYPATVYLTTQRCLHNFPIVRLFASYALWKARHTTLDGRGLLGLDGSYPLSTGADRARVLSLLERAMQHGRMAPAKKDEVVRRLVERLGLDYQDLFDSRVLRLLQPAEVARLAREGVDFQLHTHRHRTPSDPDLFVREIRENRERLEEITGQPATHFCYPSGVYRQSYPSLLRAERVVSATTCDPGLSSRRSNPLLLPRFVDTDLVSDAIFETWVTGVADWLPRRSAGYAAAH